MENSYSTTSFSLRGSNGEPAIIGPFGQLMIDSVIREGWFTKESGQGLYEYIGDQDDVIADLVHDLPGDTPDNLEEALKLYQQHHPEQITDGMLERAREFDLEGGGFSEVIDLIRLEPGCDLHELAEETGYWCDKNRHGEFGGYGWYWSPAFAMGLSSQFVAALGTEITKAAAKKDASEIAKLLLDRFVQPATDHLAPDLRKQVLAELEGLLGVDNPKRVIVSVRGGVVQELRHNVKGMSSDILDWDCGGISEEIEEEADQMPYSM